MTAPASPADRARALLRQWADVHQAATPGEWAVDAGFMSGVVWGGDDSFPTVVTEASSKNRVADADAIASDHNHFGDLLAALEAALDLADELDREADRTTDICARISLRDAATSLATTLSAALEGTPDE